MSIIEKLKGNKQILSIKEATVPDIGEGFRLDLAIGKEKRVCYIVQDQFTGEWKVIGDPRACQILSENLKELGTPLTGAIASEKLKEQVY